jgi:hypothetical protein
MDTILPASKRNSNKSTSNRPSNVAEDRQIVNHAASLRQLIQQHVTNFYRTDRSINPDQNPFGFEPATSRCMEVALRRYIATEIVDFINQYIKSGEQERNFDYTTADDEDKQGLKKKKFPRATATSPIH